MSIRKISKQEIDFNKIYGSVNDAKNQTGNTVKAMEQYWGDTGDLYYDEETGKVIEDGVGLGYINVNDLLSIDKIDEPAETETSTEDKYSKIYDTEAAKIQKAKDAETVTNNDFEEPLEQDVETGSGSGGNESDGVIHTIDVDEGKELEVDMSDIVPEAAEPAPEQTPAAPANEGGAQPSDFSFRHEDSNILAAKARNMGFTDDQIKIAIGISRWETGNYEHLAYGYNYGGVTGSGDLGQEGGYAKYSSKDVGMNAYLNNLKSNYFDQGLNSVESISRKYLGYEDVSRNWTNGVYGCMK